MISQIGASALPKDKLEEYNKITTEMAKIYSTAQVPAYKDRSKLYSLEPEITLALAESRDPGELEYYWTQWRNATGKQMRKLYARYVTLTNDAAKCVTYAVMNRNHLKRGTLHLQGERIRGRNGVQDGRLRV